MRRCTLLAMTWLLLGTNLACGSSAPTGSEPGDAAVAEEDGSADGDAVHHEGHDTDEHDVHAHDDHDTDAHEHVGHDTELHDVHDVHDHDAHDHDALTEDAGADDAVEPAVVSLIDNTAWSLVGVDVDPFVVDGGPSPDLCPESDIQSEDTPDGVWLDVSTEGCAWATLQQPLLHPVAAGDLVRITVVHFEILAGDTDYTLQVALGPDAEVIWTESVALGAGYEVIQATVSPSVAHAQGDPIWYHVSNHGENNWSLAAIDLLVP